MKNYLLSALFLFSGISYSFASGHTVSISSSTNATCYASCDGAATAAVSGGTGPFVFDWTGPNAFTGSGATISTLCAGTYTVTVTDNSDQSTATANITIAEPTELTVGTFVDGQGSCYPCAGFIYTTVLGGTPPYTYLWTPNNFTGPEYYQACAGTYNVAVTDANGCTAQATAVVQPPNPPLTIITDNQTNLDCTTPFGSITIHATGGTGNYYYYWYPGGQTTASVSNLPEGNYYVQVTDDSGDSCSAYADFMITNSYNLYGAITNTPANCGNNGTATLNIQGANPPFTFVWSPGGQTTNTITGLAAVVYTVTITDGVGCSVLGSTTIESTCMNIIQGRVYSDINQNCIQDVGEPGLAGKTIYATPGYYYGYTDANGDYTIQTPELNPTITVSNNYQNYFTPTCPATGSLTLTIAQIGSTLTGNDFGYWADPNYFDLNIHPGWSSASPGFDKTYWFLYGNNSPTSQNAVVRFIYDPALTYISSTHSGVHDAVNHKIEWTFNNLAPGSYWDWNTRPQALFNVPPTVPITATLHTDFSIMPVIGDAQPSDNVLVLDEPVTGSHDPNAKSVIPRGEGPEGNILQSDSVLFYTIHFQNDGNDTAFTVVLIDTLSENLDPATIIPGASSHPYTFALTGHGILTFRFDEIMLPDSNVNEPASHGYVNYTIKVKPGMPIGTEIENTAHIYFDFNEAIVTNTTINTIFKPDAIDEHTDYNVAVFPNPSTGRLVIDSDLRKGLYTINDITGKNLVQGQFNASRFSIDLSAFSDGIYLITLTDGETQMHGKIVKK